MRVTGWIPSASILCFALLLAPAPVLAQNIVRAPYLQDISTSSITVRWRTDTPSETVLRYGPGPGTRTFTEAVAGTRTEHVVTAAGLVSNTRYYYSVGTNTADLAGGDAEHFFDTAPTVAEAGHIRIWVLGDPGTANDDQREVRDTYLGYTSAADTDLVLMLGDNAYFDGTDAEYQAAIFDMYPMVLRNTPSYPALGNHDTPSVDTPSQTGVYYDIFSLPGHGLSGGLASGTEAYYSFDYGNVHFICLDAEDSDRSAGGPMVTWLASDLAATDKTWIIAYWHRPTYTKGSPPVSDSSQRAQQLRQNVLPLLDNYGVDLVLAGHVHSYERSILLAGHYGDSTTLQEDMKIDAGDGRENGDGAYQKSADGAASHDGIVYTVAGNSGQAGGSGLPHPVMYETQVERGSIIIDVNGLRLDALFLDEDGLIADEYTIIKMPDQSPPLLISAQAQSTNTVRVRFSEHVAKDSAEDITNYTISGATVLAAELQTPASEVLLSTSLLTENEAQILTVTGVADPIGNAIPGDSSISFVYLAAFDIEFRDGLAPSAAYSGTVDTHIAEHNVNENFGDADTLIMDGDNPYQSGHDIATLIRWDLSAIPGGANVTAATVNFNVVSASDDLYDVHALLADWDEDSASWLDATSTTAWEIPGALGPLDRDDVSLAQLGNVGTGDYSVALNAAGIARIQSWIDGAANYGFVISGTDSIDSLRFTSSDDNDDDGDDTALRPGLAITYVMPPIDGDDDSWPDAVDNCQTVSNPQQVDTNGDGIGNRCDADLNDDCIVNAIDLGLLKTDFFATGPDLDADFNGDEIVNTSDLGILKAMFFQVPGPSGLTPCP